MKMKVSLQSFLINLEGLQLLLIHLFGLVLSILIQPVLGFLQHQC